MGATAKLAVATAAVAAVAVVLFLIAAGEAPDSRVAAPQPRLTSCGGRFPAGHRPIPPYSHASPFNTPIAADAAIEPRSRRMVRGLVEATDPIGFLLSVRRWTVPVYYADPGTKRHDVRLTAEWAPRKVLRSVPIPRHAQPDPEEDGHLVIVDRASGCEYDLWQARRTADGRWRASWGNRISLRGRGIYRDGWSARASGFGLLAGLIFPEELEAGKIEHALVFSYPHTRDGDPVPPATKSDGWSDDAHAIPEGALLQLDPGLDLGELELEPHERVIAEALQRYGMYLADTGGNVSLYAAHPQAYDGDPYADLLPDDEYVVLDGIPLDRFRVLKPAR